MELTGASIDLYVRHAFGGMAKVLDRLDDDTVNQKAGRLGDQLGRRPGRALL